jgi:catechol 2,3-dioxygenase-like lactoylglutathione lyase family enzyme
VTIFTQQYRDVRDFYVDILNARIVNEKPERICELELGGVPLCLRACEHGEHVSYFHLHLALKRQDAVLGELRRRGIIVTTVGHYNNFRDPEGRVIKLSEDRVTVS